MNEMVHTDSVIQSKIDDIMEVCGRMKSMQKVHVKEQRKLRQAIKLLEEILELEDAPQEKQEFTQQVEKLKKIVNKLNKQHHDSEYGV